MNDDKLSHEIASALEKITPGPWKAVRDRYIDGHETGYSRVFAPGPQEVTNYIYDFDAEFIAQAPDLLRRALAALKQQEWQPIETAPKDGTWFLAWSSDLEYLVMRMGPGFIAAEEPDPTHWQPLPALPSSGSEGER